MFSSSSVLAGKLLASKYVIDETNKDFSANPFYHRGKVAGKVESVVFFFVTSADNQRWELDYRSFA
jgi:hypothetical protein